MKKSVNVLLEIEKLPEGYYLATSPDVTGLVVQAKTIERVVDIATDAIPDLLRLNSKGEKNKKTSAQVFYHPLQVTV